jgi:hypothetical protein
VWRSFPFRCAIAVLFFVPLAMFAQQKDECQLAPELRAILDRQWHAWRVLHIADLTPEDQNLWTYARGRVCPGATAGHFLGAQSPSYAIAVIRGHQEAVVVASQSGTHWNFAVAMPPTRVNRFRVIWLAKPGVYTDKLTGRRTLAATDPIGFEAIGDAVTMFIRQKNKFVPVRTGEQP